MVKATDFVISRHVPTESLNTIDKAIGFIFWQTTSGTVGT